MSPAECSRARNRFPSDTQQPSQQRIGLKSAVGVIPQLDVGQLAEKRHEAVDEMHSGVKQNTTSGRRWTVIRVGCHRPVEPGSELDVDMVDVAEYTLLYDVAKNLVVGMKACNESHGENSVMSLCNCDHLLSLGGACREGLLAHYIDAHLHQLDCDRRMRPGRSGDDD